MKTFVVLIGLTAIVLASKIDVKLLKQPPLTQNTKEVLQLQKAILRLFRNVYDANLYNDQVKIGETYDIEANIDNFQNPQAVRQFMDLNRLGFMPKGEIFSIFQDEPRRQAAALFKILYYANDFGTLYRTACWARLFMNEGMFVYALSTALVQRPDTAFIELPPIYEILPQYFFNKDVLQKAKNAREMYESMPRTPEQKFNYMQQMPESMEQMPKYMKQMPEYMEQMPKYMEQKPEYMEQRPEYMEQRPEYMQPQPEYMEQRPEYMEQRPYQQPMLDTEQMQKPWMRQEPMLDTEQMQKPWMRQEPMIDTEHMQKQQMPYKVPALDEDPIQKPWMGVPFQKPMYNMMPMKNSINMLRMMTWYNLFPEPIRTQLLNQMRRQMYMQEMPKQRPDMMTMMPERLDRTKGIVIDANYTCNKDLSKDYTMDYYMEDVGLNAYYYYYNIYFPSWLPNDMIYMGTDRRGEQFYYMMQQLLARYYLERLSNNLGNIPMMEYMMPIRPAYRSMLGYPNGMEFPERPDNFLLFMRKPMQEFPMYSNYSTSYMFIKDYERRIRDAIDLGYVMTPSGKTINLYEPNGFEILGNMIEGNMETPNSRFYGCLQIFARFLLGNTQYSLDNFKITPSVLEQFETSLRDPVFYQFFKRMIMYFQRYMNNMPAYSTKELLMPGVKIQDIKIDRLMTYFDYFYTDISNSFNMEKMDENMREIPVRVRQLRLNNRPFNYAMNVMCDKPYEAIVKVFLGPKLDEQGRRLDITENRLNFVEMDRFRVALLPGMNKIMRRSRDNFYSRDRTTQSELYMRVMMNLDTPMISEYEPREPSWSMPRRLLLPKGTKQGMMYQMYFMISPYRPMKVSYMKNYDMPTVNYRRIMDDYPLGYPFDRMIDESVFFVPNSMFKDVMIYHMEMDDMNRMEIDDKMRMGMPL